MSVQLVEQTASQVQQEFAKVIVGKQEIVELMIVGLMVGGHVLLEGVPGTAKTLMVRVLARLLGAQFNRIQFTPDLMPSDILGTNVFNLQTNTFHLVKGPLFTDFLLADEINRTPAKTQSALLEAMEERRVTIDGVNYPMSEHFMVFATMNPIEYEGTYPLPEAQLDRFLLKLRVGYPEEQEEDELLKRYHQGFDARYLEQMNLQAVAHKEVLQQMRAALRDVTIEESLLQYIRKLVRKTREAPEILLGGGPRASIYLLLCSKALALLRGRDFVIPDDVKYLALPVLRHRLILEPDIEIEGYSSDEIIQKMINEVEVPR